ALERLIKEEQIPGDFFDPAEIERGGIPARPTLLFGEQDPDLWSWVFSPAAGKPFTCDIPAGNIHEIAALIRAASGATDAAALADLLHLDGIPEEIFSSFPSASSEGAPHGSWPTPGAPGIYRREHASLVIRSKTTSVLTDPQRMQFGWTSAGSRYP